MRVCGVCVCVRAYEPGEGLPRRLPEIKSPTGAVPKAATPAGGDLPVPRKPLSSSSRLPARGKAPSRGSRPPSSASAAEEGGAYGFGPEVSARAPDVDVAALKASFLDEAHPEAVLALIEQTKIKREREAEQRRLAETQAKVRETLLKQVRLAASLCGAIWRVSALRCCMLVMAGADGGGDSKQ